MSNKKDIYRKERGEIKPPTVRSIRETLKAEARKRLAQRGIDTGWTDMLYLNQLIGFERENPGLLASIENEDLKVAERVQEAFVYAYRHVENAATIKHLLPGRRRPFFKGALKNQVREEHEALERRSRARRELPKAVDAASRKKSA